MIERVVVGCSLNDYPNIDKTIPIKQREYYETGPYRQVITPTRDNHHEQMLWGQVYIKQPLFFP